MSYDWQKFNDDPRPACKYGSQCYQKNFQHDKIYKHPPTIKRKTTDLARKEKRFKQDKEITGTQSLKTVTGSVKSITNKNPKKLRKRKRSGALDENVLGDVEDESVQEILYVNSDEPRKTIKDLFLVDMPEDFYDFFNCLKNDEEPVEKALANVNLKMIGPYELLLGKLPIIENKDLYLVHWRFYYDPPEFQSVLKIEGKSQYHIGYYRDSPDDKPVFVCSNDSAKDYTITTLSENIFGAVYLYLKVETKRSPFTTVPAKKLLDKVKAWADKLKYPLEKYEVKKRHHVALAKTLHTAGIVVPYNKKNRLGYRPLIISDASLKKLLAKLKEAKSVDVKDKILSELQEPITAACIALDECDFGTSLELGIDLFCAGVKELESSILTLMCPAYTLLRRLGFAAIIQAHMQHRRKGPELSVLNLM